MHTVTIDERWCKGCRLCAVNCPLHALHMAERFTKRGIHPPELAPTGRCNGCRLCELLCPDFAITITEAAGVHL